MDATEATVTLLETARMVEGLPAGAFRDAELHAAGQRLLAVLEGRLAAVSIPELDVFAR